MKIAKLKIENFGFTVIELLTVVFIMAVLTTIVMINFQAQRRSQEIAAARQDALSKIREMQSNLLAGKVLAGETAAPGAYEIIFTSGATAYAINYFIGGGAAKALPNCCQVLQNVRVKQVYVAGVSKLNARIRFLAPYGAITVDGSANQTVRIELEHTKSSQTKSIVIDGVSGRITAQ